jgi:NAD(P)-dependent dehydrogenase (short-subunit alcohol dehydrogenase family)
MTGELTGTVSVITGGGRGIGRFLARALAEAGSAVGLIARSKGELAETVRLVTAAGGTAAAVCADITDPAATLGAVDALRRRLGAADLLINNAGVSGPFGEAWQVDAGDWVAGRRDQPARRVPVLAGHPARHDGPRRRPDREHHQ